MSAAQRLIDGSYLLFIKSVSIVYLLFVSFNQFFAGWKFIHTEKSFLPGQKIMLGKTFPIRTERKFDIKHFCVFHCLL